MYQVDVYLWEIESPLYDKLSINVIHPILQYVVCVRVCVSFVKWILRRLWCAHFTDYVSWFASGHIWICEFRRSLCTQEQQPVSTLQTDQTCWSFDAWSTKWHPIICRPPPVWYMIVWISDTARSAPKLNLIPLDPFQSNWIRMWLFLLLFIPFSFWFYLLYSECVFKSMLASSTVRNQRSSE